MVSYPPLLCAPSMGPSHLWGPLLGWQKSPEKYQNQLGARCLMRNLVISWLCDMEQVT